MKSVEDDKSEGVITRYDMKGAVGVLEPVVVKTPAVGWKLSTRYFGRDADGKREQKPRAGR